MNLLTGSTGKLGSELSKYLKITPFEGDITRITKIQPCSMIIHAAAFTDVQGAEGAPSIAFDSNVNGTFNLVQRYKGVPFVYISTEYAFNPLGIYAWTKKWGEDVVKSHPHHLIIRLLHKPRPWKFDVAYKNQYTTGDYTDVMAKLLAVTISKWDKKTSKTLHIGTGRKTMYDLALQTKRDVRPNVVDSPIIPLDYLTIG